ncbi:MAG: helix-turn-helix domain-containing protein [Clostridia bacterium]|nr:helix-turn-helix domain-containing protein [Clostridia bacterium]
MELYISENIRKNRRESNLSQEVFAERMGVSFQTISKWERGVSHK